MVIIDGKNDVAFTAIHYGPLCPWWLSMENCNRINGYQDESRYQIHKLALHTHTHAHALNYQQMAIRTWLCDPRGGPSATTVESSKYYGAWKYHIAVAVSDWHTCRTGTRRVMITVAWRHQRVTVRCGRRTWIVAQRQRIVAATPTYNRTFNSIDNYVWRI